MKLRMIIEEIDMEPCILIDHPYIKLANFKSHDTVSLDIKPNRIIITKEKELDKEINPDIEKMELLQILYEKLRWYTFAANTEQFNREDVEMIVRLINILEYE